MSVKTYDFKENVLVIGGVPIFGFAEGTAIEVMRDGDSFTKKTGLDGETSRSKNNDKSGSVKITLMQTSKSNDYLSGLNLLDEQTNDGIVPVLLKDISGATTVFSGYAWVKKPADIKLEKDVGGREWTIDTGRMDIFIGGN